MDIVLLTNYSRYELLSQTIESLRQNSVDWKSHNLIVTIDGGRKYIQGGGIDTEATIIINSKQPGASACRNIGASSIPKYRRQKLVMFIDDDAYMCRGWDKALSVYYQAIASGHAHPYNHTVIREASYYLVTDVISTVNMVMPWSLWDDVGWFAEPGGPGGSEDVDYCRRATAKGYPLVITKPHCVIHCGLTSSGGKPIVGYDLMVEQNRKLVEHYRIQGLIIQGLIQT